MADRDEIIPGSSRVFNARILDRDLIRNQGMMESYYQSGATTNGNTKFGYGGNMTEVLVEPNYTAFAIYHGGTPNYYQSGAASYSQTKFGYGGNMTEVDASNSINISRDQFENGSNTLYGSGTIEVVQSGEIANFRF